jgi:hypothetical protein
MLLRLLQRVNFRPVPSSLIELVLAALTFLSAQMHPWVIYQKKTWIDLPVSGAASD